MGTSRDEFPRYAGFPPRIGAQILDGIFLIPFALPVVLLDHRYRLFYLYYFPVWLAFSLFFYVFLVSKYGGTPGKLILGMRIQSRSGGLLGNRDALLRTYP